MEARSLVRVLDADPDLCRSLDRSAALRARAEATAPLLRLDAGRWVPPSREGVGDAIALLVLDGLLVRSVRMHGRRGAEIVGPGDILRPWQTGADGSSLTYEIDWIVAVPTSVAAIGPELVRRWPDIASEVVERGVERARSLGVMLAIGRLPGARERVLALLWHLADRFGRVEPGGIRLRLRIDQATLGDLVHLGRQAVCHELSALGREGVLERRGGGWLLRGEPPVASDPTTGRFARDVAPATPGDAERRPDDAQAVPPATPG